MSTNSPSQNPQDQTNTETQSTTSSSPQETGSQSATENAREQVDQILDQTREGFSFESIAESILKSIGKLWKSLGITNLIDYIAGFFGFSTGSENQSQEQAPQPASSREYPLQTCDTVPQGGKILYAQEDIILYKESKTSYSDDDMYNYLFKGQTAILMPPCQPDSQGNYKIKALGRGTDTQSVKYLYLKSTNFNKLGESNPGARKTIGTNTYLSGDSISQIFCRHTAYGEGMPNHNMRYICRSIVGQVAAGRISQKRIAFIMGYNNLSSRNLETIKQHYNEAFGYLKSLKDNYGKDISINLLYNWTKSNGELYMSEELRGQINSYIQEKCQQFGFRCVSMENAHDQSKGLHTGFQNQEAFLRQLTS